MVTWGLGIEHEFILKFDKKKMIGNNFYDLFINSNLIKNLSALNEINFYQNNKSFIKNNPYYKEYIQYMEDLILIRNYAINNKKYPFEKKNFFNILISDYYNNNKFYIDNETIEKMTVYYEYFTLYHDPILYFNFKFDDNYFNIRDIFISSLLTKSNDKELLIKHNYDLFNKIFEKKNHNNIRSNLKKTLLNEYELVKIFCTNTFYFERKKGGSIKNEKNLLNLCLNQVKHIKKYIFNNIKFDKEYINDIFYCYKNKIPELDISSNNYLLEMKTIEYKNLNYEKIYKNLIRLETNFIKYIQMIIHDKLKKFGNIIYSKIGSRKESIELIDIFNELNEDFNYKVLKGEDYTGSYHLWITCPYDKKISKMKFLNIHANLANKLQLLEPLLACNFSSPSYEIKYNKNYPSKLSLRHFLNSYCNYGSTDISLINGSEYTDVKHIFFKKENSPTIEKVHPDHSAFKKKVYNVNNTLIKNYNILNDRKYTNNVYSFMTKKKNNSKNVNVTSYYELLFKNKKLSFKKFKQAFKKEEDFNIGSDIRTRDNNYMMYPLDKSFRKIYYPKNNKYIVYYINKDGTLFDKRKYDKNEYIKYLNEERMGIEFRIFDHFNTLFLNQILAIIPYLVMESYNTYSIKSINDTFVSKQFWHNEMYKVVIEGYTHNFSKNYIDQINKEFNLGIKNKKYTSELLLEEIYKSFINKYSKLRKYKLLLSKLKFNSHITFVSLGEYATKMIQQNN